MSKKMFFSCTFIPAWFCVSQRSQAASQCHECRWPAAWILFSLPVVSVASVSRPLWSEVSLSSPNCYLHNCDFSKSCFFPPVLLIIKWFLLHCPYITVVFSSLDKHKTCWPWKCISTQLFALTHSHIQFWRHSSDLHYSLLTLFMQYVTAVGNGHCSYN